MGAHVTPRERSIFKREAKWLMVVCLVIPAIGILPMLVVPGLPCPRHPLLPRRNAEPMG
jgi:hypothetical protein